MSIPLPPRSDFFALVSAVARDQPDQMAAIAAGEQITYAELARRAEQIAAAMSAQGLDGDSRIGLLCNNRLAWLEIFIAVSRIGATIVPISTWSTPSELVFILGDCRVDALFTLPSFGGQDWRQAISDWAGGGDRAKPVVSIEGDHPSGWLDYAAYPAADTASLAPRPSRPADAAFVVLYTSGSSSRPKAVPLVEATILENGFDIGERQGLRPDDRVLVSIPLFWSYGAANALPATLTHGATLVLQSRFEPDGALDLIDRHRCTAIYTLPAMTSALLSHPKFTSERTRSLRTGVTIGSPQDVVRAATELGISQICNIYGSTETYGNCCVTPNDWPLERRANCQGPPLPGMKLRIRDAASGALVPAGHIGQIEVSGYLTPGYLFDSAQHNSDVFTADGWFRSGDLGRLNDDGTLVYSGRSSEMIKRSGINVSPAEVEEVLQQHPDVALAGVTGTPDALRGEIIIAYVIPRPGSHPLPDELLRFCRERLSSYKLPDRIVPSTELPLTPTGKLMRRELKAMAAAAARHEA